MARKLSVNQWGQWNVRLSPALSAALHSYLSDPLLVGLPKGAVSSFFTEALTRELAKRGVVLPDNPPPPEQAEPQLVVPFF